LRDFIYQPSFSENSEITSNRAFEKLNESGITIIMVSHDVNSAVSNASKILHLAKNWYFYGTAHQYLHSDAGKRFILSDCPCDECQHRVHGGAKNV